ncbi:mRNA-decapping enzyme 1A-like [Argiope bruennichi]|uniref:mRNA-decapping enzyme 1A-like n=1 Tax=Argiope bruennichi TaxID=94029 RepID=UPI002494FEB1|nr:mRNA-decapping enzyme 1A-like [Argiope bruennichi]
MSDSEATKINLAALRKVDSTISSIVEGSNQVALYKYLSEESRWEKTDIEGTLFVYVRSNKPQHGFMIMNRLSTTNLVEPITEKLEFQDQTPFLLYRNGEGDIYGIWFYEDKNCVKVYKLLSSLSQLAFNKSDKSNSIRQRSYSESNRKQQKPGNAQMDIISLLTRAQDEYDKKSAAKGTSKASKNNQHASNGDIVKPTPVRVNGATKINTNTPLTLGMLFAQAGGIEKKPNENAKDFDARVRSFTASSCNMLPNNSAMNTESILQNLLSNSAHTLQHIEGMQRTENSQPSKETRALSVNDRIISVQSLEKDLKEKLNILPKSEGDINADYAIIASQPTKSEPIDIPILTPAMLHSNSFSSVPAAPAGSFLEKAEGFYDNNTDSFPIIKECKSFSPSQLLSPMDFTGPCRKKNVQPSLLSSSYSPEPGSVLLNGNGNSHEDLLNPQSLINGHIAGNLQPAGKLTVTPLNKDQFKEALIYMLQNDDAFVMQLHECYVKSLKTQLNSLNST